MPRRARELSLGEVEFRDAQGRPVSEVTNSKP